MESTLFSSSAVEHGEAIAHMQHNAPAKERIRRPPSPPGGEGWRQFCCLDDLARNCADVTGAKVMGLWHGFGLRTLSGRMRGIIRGPCHCGSWTAWRRELPRRAARTAQAKITPITMMPTRDHSSGVSIFPTGLSVARSSTEERHEDDAAEEAHGEHGQA